MAKVAKLTGVMFTVHDLRRTFIDIAGSLDISSRLKSLVNLKVSNDVNGGYVFMMLKV